MKQFIKQGILVLAVVAVVVCGSTKPSFALLMGGVSVADIPSPTVEHFQGAFTLTSSFDFGNGLTYLSLSGSGNLLNYTNGYGMGNEAFISSGRGGAGDGYFGTGDTPETFQLAFIGGANYFGFYGAESVVPGGSAGRNGVLDLEFYDLSSTLIEAVSVPTAGTFAWNQFHGFFSDDPINRVVFRGAGHMVLDDVYFASAPVPEPGTWMLMGTGLVALLSYSWRKRQRQTT